MLDLLMFAGLFIVQTLLAILPDSPITSWLESIDTTGGVILQALGVLNWVVDINGMEVIMGVWLTCIMAYLVWRLGSSAYPTIMQGFRGIFNLGEWIASFAGPSGD